jgi:bacteriorhodopsin
MDAKHLFYKTLVISIIVQVVTGLVELGAFFVKIPSAYAIIRQLLALELVVQLLEGAFYVWLAYNFTKVVNVTPKRYIDWVITTPTMLVTLMIYLIYLNKKANQELTADLEFFTICKENAQNFISVVLLNWLMLLFGFLGEMKIIPVLLGVVLGFIPFLMYYYLIYKNYVKENNNGYLIFWYFFIFWALYGFVAVLPYYAKNAFYNILDLFAKNFFGIFLSYMILSGHF